MSDSFRRYAISAPDLAAIRLGRGTHGSREDGVCALEAVAWLAGEPHSDHPDCVCPILAEFVRNWNDSLDDEQRNRLLKPMLPRLIGTRGSDGLAKKRSYLALDWLIREATPAWLDLVPSLSEHAASLRALGPIVAIEDVRRARPIVRLAADGSGAVGDAALTAARVAEWDAAQTAARTAAQTVARVAILNAAWVAIPTAARTAAQTAAQTAARTASQTVGWTAAQTAARTAAQTVGWTVIPNAAWTAARTAALDTLRPTVEALQVSALRLVERMIEAA